MNNSNQLNKIINELSYLLRFGGVCSAIQFNPTNISSEVSKNVTLNIINSINEYMWTKGIDTISTNYSNGGTGFMLLTTHSNKEAMKEIISNIDIKKNIKNEYLVSADDIIDLSKKTNKNNFSHVVFSMKIIDNYKINTKNQFTIDLNENSNISDNVQICERSIVNHLRNLNLVNDETDSGLLSIINNMFQRIVKNSKKYAVPGIMLVVLFNTLNYVYQKWKTLDKEKKSKNKPISLVDNKNESSNFFEIAEQAEPAEPFEPSEPFEPAEPSDFQVNLTTRTVHNNRISTLLKTLEDSEVKNTKTTNIEAKILSLLAETTESR
jgi:hypothetical protein